MVVSSRNTDLASGLSLDGRVALITGSGRGFGRALALAFVRSGARVVLTAGRNQAELDETLAMVDVIAPGAAVGMLADAGSRSDTDKLLDLARLAFGGIDILINNAARGPSDAMPVYDIANPLPFWDAMPERYEEVVMTNVVGPFLMARAVVPDMLARGFGRIINISTSRPTMIRRGGGPYGATKAALEVNTRVWADDLRGTGVTVNALLPGAASDTALIPGGDVGARAPSDFRPGRGTRGDLGRMDALLPADILVPPALWIASEQSAAWTGRRIIAKDWDAGIDPSEAIRAASSEPLAMPDIL
ncbi:SDR family NAD(P)-dependent oxidoreductase [Novosphingobium sp. BL-52-GroH]|uniref:SDR family NAD(P)-dependent oxidoreductase n=1 Tax=Novosphingobium sp. BL-52-GroH TaxID=3349877 RepID=UPI00384A9677